MRILFIVNPISGFGVRERVAGKNQENTGVWAGGLRYCFTEYAGHGRILVEEARSTRKYTHIVAVGGDGTVNEVGGALCGSDIAFAVVSLGSGNGFARHSGVFRFYDQGFETGPDRPLCVDRCAGDERKIFFERERSGF